MSILGNARRLLSTVLLLAAALGAQEAPAPAPAPAKAPGLEARLKIKDKESLKVILLGRKDGKVVYCFAESPQVVSAVAPQEVTSIRLSLNLDRTAVGKARRAGDWATAGTLMGRALSPALPFLDVPGNNALPAVIRAGIFFLLAAEQKTGCAFDATARAAAEKEYLYAYALFKPAAGAEWSERAEAAKMLSVLSLVGLGKVPEAKELLGTLSEPEVEDETYGLYHLASAELLNASGDSAAALETVIAGIVFEDKEIDTFPSSLLLSAYAYAKLGDWHRARDVYYEVAMLFPGTHWDKAARAALQKLMAEGKTSQAEAIAAQAVFFGLDEDVNAKVKALLNPAPPAAAKTSAPSAPAATAKDVKDTPAEKTPNEETEKP